jgi:hypothetical protein
MSFKKFAGPIYSHHGRATSHHYVPFGTAHIFENKLYIQKQGNPRMFPKNMKKNPRFQSAL